MKKFGFLGLSLALVLVMTGCGSQPQSNVMAPPPPPETETGVDQIEEIDWEGPVLAVDCEQAGGIWLASHSECEDVEEDWCLDMGGEWHDCESACRHDPEADFCTEQCVFVCKFAEFDMFAL